jgi:hypothetical protein
MILQSDLLKQLATVYVVALAGVDSTGLTAIASAPNYPFFAAALDPAVVPAILQEIVDSTVFQGGECVPAGGNVWVAAVDDAHLPDPIAVPPINNQIIGYVYLYDQQGNALPNGQGQAPIMRDPQTGASAYTFPNLMPGTYVMRAFLAYKGDDQITRIYNKIFDPNTATLADSRTIVVAPNGGVIVADNLFLDLGGSVCPEP